MTKRGKKGQRRGPGGAERQHRRRVAERKAAQAAKQAEADEAALAAAFEWLERLEDPETPIPEVVGMLLDRPGAGEPVIPGRVDVLRGHGASTERVAAIAAALTETDRDPKSVTALSFAALAARAAGDLPGARRLLDEVFARRPDPDDQLMLARYLSYCGRFADALDIVEPRVRADPSDDDATIPYGEIVEALLERPPPDGPCECGSGERYLECCRPREQAALHRFTDRSGMYELRDALIAWLPESEYAEAVDRGIDEWLEYFDDLCDDVPQDTLAALAEMAAEHALLVAGRSDDDEVDDDEDTPLATFAADPDTPAELADRVHQWREYVRYGLWQVDAEEAGPGVWLTDILTGTTRYVAMAPEQREGIMRWAVLLGAIVPVDGVWRLGRSAFQLSPTEADAACATLDVAAQGLLKALVGRRSTKERDRANGPLPFGRAEPYGVYATTEEPAEPALARLMGMVAGSLLPRIVAEVLAHRLTPPTLTNTDKEPVSLITARVRVADGVRLTQRLAEHADFDTTDPERVVWYGAQVPAGRRAAMLAEMRAQLAVQGRSADVPEDDDGSSRWVRGQLWPDGDGWRVEVNSRQRLDALLGLLRELGAEPEVVDESRVDPRLDLPWTLGSGSGLLRGGAAAPDDGWEAHWLDEHVPALRGLTPMTAAFGRPEDHARLEALLREFEYQGALLACAGEHGPDVGWLRDKLDMPLID